jgi:4-hydroxy-tetrahydrodipicolinate synthase
MDSAAFKTILCGYSVTTAVPFVENLSKIDSDGLRRNIEFLAKNQVPLIIPNGNTGEFYSLSEEEWLDVVKISIDAAGERTTVMTGIGHSIKTAISQIRKAQGLNVPAAMVMYPQHVFVSEEGILDYYRAIFEVSKGMNIVLYKKGPLLSDAVLSKLLSYENFIGVKYAFGRIVDFTQSVQKLGNKIVWSCGTAERFAPFFWLGGAQAFTSGLGNFAPRVTQRMYDALRNSDYDEAMKIQEMVSPLEFLREGHNSANNVPVIKAAMDSVGLVGGFCRPPIHRLNETERLAVEDIIKSWKL